MVQAYILLTIAIGKMNSVIGCLNSLDFIEMVNSVTGPCDIIIKIKAKDYHELKESLYQLQSIDGIMESSTSLVVEL